MPVVGAFPVNQEQCNDLFNFVAASPIGIKGAAIIATALLVTYLIRKYGSTILTALRSRMKEIVVAVQKKISRQRSVYLLPSSQTVVMG